MIASIRGEVLVVGAGWAVIEVGGVGMRAEVPARTRGLHAGAQVFLHTQLVVREDSMTLFGFSTPEELEVFGILLGVSGVGPRSALGVLSELSPVEVARAAAAEDEKPFRKVSGIGPKTAKLIAVQLAGKLQGFTHASGPGEGAEAAGGASGGGVRAASTVEQGLLGLGYSEAQAKAAVQDALDAGAPGDEAGLLRAALLLLQTPRLGARSSTSEEGGR